jgi:fluoride ion exporter CrcB/FEX
MRRSLKKHWHNLESCWAYPLGGATHSFARWNKLNAAELNRTLVANVTGSFLIAQATAKPMVMQGRATCLPNLKTSRVQTQPW